MILALDQSLTETGYCLSEPKTGYKRTGVIKPKKLRGVERLNFIEKQLKDLIILNHITRGIMEGYSYGSIGRTFELGELGGVIKRLFSKWNIPLEVVPPTKWKKAIIGKGNANKDRVILEVWKQYGMRFKNNNMCDAFCLCLYLEKILEEENDKT